MIRRRDFITRFGGPRWRAWPLAARAQQEPIRQIGVLTSAAGGDPILGSNLDALGSACETGLDGEPQSSSRASICRWRSGQTPRRGGRGGRAHPRPLVIGGYSGDASDATRRVMQPEWCSRSAGTPWSPAACKVSRAPRATPLGSAISSGQSAASGRSFSKGAVPRLTRLALLFTRPPRVISPRHLDMP